MAILPDGVRFEIWANLMRKFSEDKETVNIKKADLRDAVNAIDDYLENNASNLNQAIPQPARNFLTTKQKALLLMYVVNKRYLAEG